MIEQFYNTVLCQALSPCKRYLIVGDIYGSLTIFDLQKLLKPSELIELENDSKRPKYRFSLTSDSVCCLESRDSFLIAGHTNQICGYDWASVLSSTKIPKLLWSVSISIDKQYCRNSQNSLIDVNCMAQKDEHIFAGCDNGTIHKVDLNVSKTVQVQQSSHGSVYDVALTNNTVVTCGEDGVVRTWDTRMKDLASDFSPVKHNAKLDRPCFGSWLGAVDITSDNWLICGGGPMLSMWHLGIKRNAVVFSEFNGAIFQAKFKNDDIVAAGSAGALCRYSIEGDLLSEIPVSATTVYSVLCEFSDKANILSIGGNSSKIDLCTTSRYKDFVLDLM